MRSTVAVPMWRAAAIAVSVALASACSKMWARLSLRAATAPFLVKVRSVSRSASVKVTRYFLVMDASRFRSSIPQEGWLIKFGVVDH